MIGWRYEQDYVGVQVLGPEPLHDPLYSEETRIRFSWSLDRRRWLPQSYLEPTEYPGSEYLADGSLRHDPFAAERLPFNERCAPCHNTYPYDLRLYRIFSEDGIVSGLPPGPLGRGVVQALARGTGGPVGTVGSCVVRNRVHGVVDSGVNLCVGRCGARYINYGRGRRRGHKPERPLLRRIAGLIVTRLCYDKRTAASAEDSYSVTVRIDDLDVTTAGCLETNLVADGNGSAGSFIDYW